MLLGDDVEADEDQPASGLRPLIFDLRLLAAGLFFAVFRFFFIAFLTPADR
jgi:hypothetical protein